MSSPSIVSINPSTEEVHAVFEPQSDAAVDEALSRAARAARAWRATRLDVRAQRLAAIASVLRRDREYLARCITEEMGKPLAEARAEVDKCAWCCDHYAAEGPKLLVDQHVQTSARSSFVTFEPLGIVLAVMPWNFPLWQVFRFAPATLLSGNGIVLKHAANVPRCALAIAGVIDEVCPRGLLTTLLVGPEKVPDLLADNRIAAVTLTGSTEVGEKVAALAGRHLKRQVLELGGSDPFIVLADADIATAAAAAVFARNLNGGQSCISAKRFIVEKPVVAEFTDAFAAGVSRLRVGDPLADGTQVGPLARHSIRESVVDQVRRSTAAGARLVTGGTVPDGRGYFYTPAVLDHVGADMPVAAEETFGPVAAVIAADDAEQAIALGNATEFGLGASLWTADLDRASALVPQIDAGAVFVNDVVASDPRVPFGGIKRSGYGRELGEFGLREFCNIKTVWIGPSRDVRTPSLSE